MQEFTYLGQVVLAMFLGALLGWQRERWGKSAGPRTYALVTGGAALFTILSINGFGLASSDRVASNVVVGIGFLGAGLIFLKDDRVQNLTTAAGLWASAAIGMAVGTGFYILPIGSTLVMYILLMLDDRRFRKNGAQNDSEPK